MASFTKVNDFVAALANGEINLGSDTLTIALSNTAPGSETSNPTADTNGILGNVTEVAYTFLSSRVITTDASSQTGGTYTLSLDDITLSASGGTVATFQYIYVYSDTSTTPDDQLVGLYDYGSGLSLADGESLTIDWGADGPTTGALLTIA